jgi:Bacterial protein of unknown function (DUF839)
MRRHRLALSLALPVALAALSATMAMASHSGPGFKTAKRPYLVATEPGVVVEPILSVGDTVGGYQMSGIPDGLGAYKDRDNTVHVLMNHELGRSFPNTPPGVDARISKVTLDGKTHGVLSATYLFNGSEGFERFCSSTLEELNGTPYYFTGEEAIPQANQPPGPAHDGSSIVMNGDSGEWTETPHFGHFQHENVVPVPRLSKFVAVSTEDDFRIGQPAHMYAYIADSFDDAVSGDPAHGSLHVWRAIDPSQTNLAKGETIDGEFVPISQAENASSTTLKAAATARQAFRFARLEDAAVAQQHPGRLYFTDTGKSGENTLKGRLYRLDIDSSDPTKASVTLLLDGDTGDDMVNPDNIDTSAHSVVINEDRESAFRSIPGRVLVYDVKTGSIRPVAAVATTPPLRPGEWEASGVINAQTLLGHGWWLLDVQAHRQTERQPGPAPPGVQPTPDTSVGEDGQLLALYVPDS